MLLLLLLITSVAVTRSQIKTDTSFRKQKSPVLVNKTVAQPQTTSPSLTPPKKVMQTATSDVVLLPTEGKDLRIVIDKMEDVSGNTNTFYLVHYSVINSGTVDLDISNITVQGAFNKNGTSINYQAGGWVLTPAYLNNRTLLRPGESFQGEMNASLSHVLVDGSFTYTLIVDNNNRIAEADENNNKAQLAIQPHKQPDLIPTNLKVIFNPQTGKWDISYVLTNAGKNPIDLNYVSFQGYFDAVIPYGPPIGGCGFTMGSLSGPTILNPNENYTGSFSCTQNNLRSGKEYDYSLTFTSNYPVPELTTANNKAVIRITAP